MTIDILNVDCDLEAIALRGVLEYWCGEVRLRHIPTAGALVCLLDGSSPVADNIILSCHGDNTGLLLPELAPEIDAEQPYSRVLRPGDFRQFLHLPRRLVVNTGCMLGQAAVAESFLHAGCAHYIGATDYPDGKATAAYVLQLFYGLISGQNVVTAHERAARYDSETGQFKLYRSGSTAAES